MAFDSFSPGLMDFLSGLRANNDKAWFEAHRGDYDTHFVGEGKAFVIAAGQAIRAFAPDVVAEPKINGSMFRINRDTRFSKDKRPYKHHLDMWFWEGERKRAVSGFFLRILPDMIGCGVGAHSFDKDRLAAYRAAVANPASGAALVGLSKELEGNGYEIGGSHYKRPPKDVEAPPGAEPLLLHNALYVHISEDPAIATKPGALMAFCSKHWRALTPLHRWLVDHIQNG